MQLSIIIVNYNVKCFLEHCLYSVRRAIEGIGAEIIVVDNASTDSSIAYLQPRFPEVIFLASKTNLGFAKACNWGSKHASGQYHLFLNPDTLLAEDTLHHCIRFFENNPQAGAVGVRMIDGSGSFLKESKRGFPGPMAALFRLTGLAALFPHSKIFSAYYVGHLPVQQSQAVPVLAGAFMMVPQTVLQQTGGFDEAFFMYGEDIDLSYRIAELGYSNHYLGNTAIIHFKGESTQRHSIRYVWLFYKAMHLFVRKHYRGPKAFFLKSALYLGIALRALLSAAEKGLRSIMPKKRSTAWQQPVIIAGGEKEFETIAPMFKQKGIDTSRLQALEDDAGLPKNSVLLFCTGTFSLSRIIAWMQQHQRRFYFRFWVPGSGSVVGSDDAGSNGDVVRVSDE